MKDSPQAPQPPDPVATAQAQSGYNADTARLQAQLNRYNVSTPNYTQTWQQNGGTSPDYDAYNKALTAFNSQPAAQTGVSASQAGPTPGYAWYEDPFWAQQDQHGSQSVQRGQAPTLDQFQKPSDQWSTSYELTPAGQQTFDQQQQIQSQLAGIAGTAADRVQNTLGQDFNPTGLPALQSGVQGGQIANSFQGGGPIQRSVPGADDFSADRQKYEDALYSRLEPQLARDREALINRTINTGHLQGSQGYDQALDAFGRQATDARMQAILQGGQEQQRMFGMGLAGGQFANAAQQQQYGQNLGQATFGNQAQQQGFGQGLANAQLGNQARQQGFGEQSYLRSLPLNETTALMSGSQVQMPNVQPTAGIGVQPVDYSGLVNNQYLGQIANNNAEIAGNNAMTQGLFQLGGTIAGFPMAGGGSLGGNAFARLLAGG